MPPLDTEDGHQWLLAFIEKLGGVDFVVFDNCMALTVGDLREETTWATLVPLCSSLSVRKIGQLWLHHTGHDKSRAYGSRSSPGRWTPRASARPSNDNDADVSFKLDFQKARRRSPANRHDFEPVTVTLRDGQWASSAVTAQKASGGKLSPEPPTALRRCGWRSRTPA